MKSLAYQRSSTSKMLFPCAERLRGTGKNAVQSYTDLIHYLSDTDSNVSSLSFIA